MMGRMGPGSGPTEDRAPEWRWGACHALPGTVRGLGIRPESPVAMDMLCGGWARLGASGEVSHPTRADMLLSWQRCVL